MVDVMDNEVFEFTATITGERYYNEESNWGVYVFSTEDDIPHLKKAIDQLNDEYLLVSTLCGKVQKLYLGSEYKVKAQVEYNSKYSSYQYKPISVIAQTPKSDKEKLLFLETMIRHDIATQLLEQYPTIIEDIINGKIKKECFDTSSIKGMGSYTFGRLYDNIIDNYVLSDVITMLQPVGVSYAMIKKLISNEPNPSLLKQKLEENPYIITNIRGIGFKKADSLALKIKPEFRKSIYRLTSFIQYYLRECGDNDGHTWISIDELKNSVANEIPECFDLLPQLLKSNTFLYSNTINGNEHIGLKYMYDIEINIADILMEKISTKIDKFDFSEEDINKAIETAEKEQGFNYTEEQRNIIIDALKSNVAIISGKAGSGKTTISRAILQAYKDKSMSITCVALSAKAAQRISEATSLPASTIHRALVAEGLDKFHYNHDNPLVTDVVYLDEASMVNARIFYDLLSAIGESTRIIISGDYLQLPPIGYGNIFADTLNNEQSFKSYQLKKVMRQAEKSGILSDANKIREGINPIQKPELKIVHGELQDMFYMFRENREALNNIAIKTFLSSIEKDGLDNVVIVTPRRKDCLNSSAEINKKIQEILLGKEKKYVDKKYIKFYKGAKVIQNVNNYEKKIFNGEMGYIKDINIKNVDNNEVKMVYVEFDDAVTGDKKVVEYAENEISQLDLAYALTCHKIQGSGFKTVIGIIDNTHYALLDSCMLYTMLTRAKQRCLLLAEPSAFIKCIHTNKNVTRKTWLRDLKYLKTN